MYLKTNLVSRNNVKYSITTINRESSAIEVYSHRYSETFVWSVDDAWNKVAIVDQQEDYLNGSNAHMLCIDNVREGMYDNPKSVTKD